MNTWWCCSTRTNVIASLWEPCETQINYSKWTQKKTHLLGSPYCADQIQFRMKRNKWNIVYLLHHVLMRGMTEATCECIFMKYKILRICLLLISKQSNDKQTTWIYPWHEKNSCRTYSNVICLLPFICFKIQMDQMRHCFGKIICAQQNIILNTCEDLKIKFTNITARKSRKRQLMISFSYYLICFPMKSLTLLKI